MLDGTERVHQRTECRRYGESVQRSLGLSSPEKRRAEWNERAALGRKIYHDQPLLLQAIGDQLILFFHLFGLLALCGVALGRGLEASFEFGDFSFQLGLLVLIGRSPFSFVAFRRFICRNQCFHAFQCPRNVQGHSGICAEDALLWIDVLRLFFDLVQFTFQFLVLFLDLEATTRDSERTVRRSFLTSTAVFFACSFFPCPCSMLACRVFRRSFCFPSCTRYVRMANCCCPPSDFRASSRRAFSFSSKSSMIPRRVSCC